MIRVVFNQKGGVGKSTINCNLATISAAQGARTLDFDRSHKLTHEITALHEELATAHQTRDARTARPSLEQKLG